MMRRREFIETTTAWALAAAPGWGRTWIGTSSPGFADGWQSRTIPTPIREGQTQPPVVTGLALQPHGNLLAVVGDDHAVNLWDLVQEQYTGQYIRHLDWVRAARFTPDGRSLLTAGNDGKLLLWEMSAAGEMESLWQHDSALLNIAVSHDGATAAVVGFQAKIVLIDLRQRRVDRSWAGPCDDLCAVAFSLDDRQLAAGGRTGVVGVWNLPDRALVTEFRTLPHRVRSLQFLVDGRIVACGNDGCLALLDPRNPERSQTFPRLPTKLFAVQPLEGNLVATGGSDNLIHVWDWMAAAHSEVLRGHTGTVTCLDYRPGLLVSGSYDTQVRVWESQRQALALPPTTSPPTTSPTPIWK